MHERLGNDDQHALGAAAEKQPVQDQARFDRLPQADFVGEQHSGNEPPGHFRRDTQLVGQQIDAASEIVNFNVSRLQDGQNAREFELRLTVVIL